MLLNRLMTGERFSSRVVSETDSVSWGTDLSRVSMMCWMTLVGEVLGKRSDCEPSRGMVMRQ